MFMELFLFLNGVLLSGSATAERDPQVRVLQSGVRISLIAEHPDLNLIKSGIVFITSQRLSIHKS